MAEIDRHAENLRAAYVTVTPGQALVYEQKRREAEAVMSGGTDAPHIAAEAEMNGISIEEQARAVIAASDKWRAASVAIETRRLSAKAAVRAATNPADIEAATALI
ncbi:hypothetical protein [Aquamicrobium sp. LC103]|uniref:hypothetical protein n=1 Tax=Aquamicrobium sp. LC103 TaxID=1120658 RepID=UPI00063EA799|nr:hypothetical protein [Aquamicrobium sp. LC103]TKT78438.1 hypothetical protein XW59_012545 [Aquamicrobium sp. LC103]